MKKKLFEKLSKTRNNFDILGVVVAKLLIMLLDVPFLILGIWLAQSSPSLVVRVAGLVITIAAGIVYVYGHIKWLIPAEFAISKKLFRFFNERAFNFYNGYNTGLIKH